MKTIKVSKVNLALATGKTRRAVAIGDFLLVGLF